MQVLLKQRAHGMDVRARVGTRQGLILPRHPGLPSPPAWLLDLCLLCSCLQKWDRPQWPPASHPLALLVYVHVNGPLRAGPAAERKPASHLEPRLLQNVYGARSRNETTSILLTGPKHCTHSWPARGRGPRAAGHPASVASRQGEQSRGASAPAPLLWCPAVKGTDASLLPHGPLNPHPL